MKNLIVFLILSTPVWAQKAAVVNGVPPGMSVTTSGILQGTPTAFGTYQFTVQVCDAQTPPSCANAPVTILISPQPISINPIVLPSGMANVPYAPQQFSASGGLAPYTWKAQ